MFLTTSRGENFLHTNDVEIMALKKAPEIALDFSHPDVEL